MTKIFMLGLLMATLCSFSSAQDMNDVWKETLASLSAEEIMQTFTIEANLYKKISKKFSKEILEAIKEIEVLENPDSRSLPQTTACLVFFLKENRIFTIEIVKEHWFQANILSQGRSTRFVLRDKKDKLAETIMNILNPSKKPAPEKPAPEKQSAMCHECSQMMFPMAMGNCETCKAPTRSMSFKFCDACAIAKGVCQVCEKKMK